MPMMDDVDGPNDSCDNDQAISKIDVSPSLEKSVEVDKNKIEIPSIRTEGENEDNNVDIDEDTDKQDDDISESDYSYVTVADLSKKEDISQSDIEDQNKLQKENEANIKEDVKEDKKEASLSNEGSKGFMASMKSTIGGFFYIEKESEKPDPHVPREFLMQPTSQDENISSSSLTKKQPINLKDENETIMEETEPIEVKTDKEPAIKKMATCLSETPKEKEEEDTSTTSKDNLLEKTTEEKPAVVEMISCPSESSNQEKENHNKQIDSKASTEGEDAAVVTMITCHSEENKGDDGNAKAKEDNAEVDDINPAKVEMITCHAESESSDKESKDSPSALPESEAHVKINLPFSPTSVQPREPYPQSDKSCEHSDNEEQEDTAAVREVKKVLNEDYKQQILEGTEGIETIINNLFVVLGELSKSVGCQKSITDIKDELDSFKQASAKISKEVATLEQIEDQTSDAGESLSLVVRDVKESILKSKNVSVGEKSSTVDAKEFDKLLINCQELLMDLESITGKQKSQTPPSTPEEFHDAKEAMSASASFAEKKSVENRVDDNKGDTQATDDVDGSSLTKRKDTEDTESSEPGANISFVAHQVKSFDDEDGDDKNECAVEESESSNVSSKANTEGIGKLRTKMIEETVSSESTKPNENGLTQTISQTVTRTITTISDTPLPETNAEPSAENDKPSPLASELEAKPGQTEETIKITSQTTTQSSVTNNFPSLDSSDTDGYHFATPPVMSLESDIQPRGIDIDTLKSDPLSLTSISEDILISESKSFSSSSDYKVITEERYVSIEKYSSKNGHPISDNLAVDSGTDDQMSSGTFSQDEISPRFADLPQQLNVEKKRTFSTSDAYKRSTSDTLHQDLKKTTKDRSLSMETRSTSMTSDVSDQEIPPTTPRSDLTISPSSEAQVKFMYGDNVEKASTDTMDIMTQSIYVGSDVNDYDSEISSESHLSSVQTTQQKISSSDDSKVTTTLKEESTKVFESVRKLSENVTENIMEETKTITKSTKMAVEESFVSLKEEAEGKHDSDEKLLKNKDNSDTETGSKDESPNQKDASIEKSESVLKTVVSTESSVMVTKTDTRSYSDVLKSEKSIESKHEIVKTIDSEKEKRSSIGKEAATEVLKSEPVLQLVDSKQDSSNDNKSKKLSYSEVLKSDISIDKKDDKDKEDPIADWGKP